jgi:hypothetical protein
MDYIKVNIFHFDLYWSDNNINLKFNFITFTDTGSLYENLLHKIIYIVMIYNSYLRPSLYTLLTLKHTETQEKITYSCSVISSETPDLCYY